MLKFLASIPDDVFQMVVSWIALAVGLACLMS